MAAKRKSAPKRPADPNATAVEVAIRHRLRELRLKREWTAEQAAEALNAGADAYRKWETVHNPPLYIIPRVVLIYGITYEWLFTGRRERLAAVPGSAS